MYKIIIVVFIYMNLVKALVVGLASLAPKSRFIIPDAQEGEGGVLTPGACPNH